MGSLLLAWLGALVGARLALAVADAVRCTAWQRVAGESPAAESYGQEAGDAAVTDLPQRESGAAESTLNVHLASNGARPDMAGCIKSFAADVQREGGHEGSFVAAAGGPETLLDALHSSLPTDDAADAPDVRKYVLLPLFVCSKVTA